MENFINHKDVQVLDNTKVWRNAEIINYDVEKLEFTVKFKNFTPFLQWILWLENLMD